MNQHAARRILATALAVTAAVPALASVTISGNGLAQAGNNGNQVVQQSVHAAGAGSFTVGPVSGTQGGNTVRADFSVAAFPQPALAATVTGGEDGTLATNNTLAHVDIDLAYPFQINGPQDGVAVPIVFTGFTDGTTFFSGNNQVSSRDQVGTAFRLIAPAVGNTFHSIAAGSAGTTGTTYISNSGLAIVGWGASAAFTVGYTDYSSSFAYGATLYSGLANAGTMELRLLADGGTSGSAFPPGAPAAGQSTAFIDPIISIDPDWLALHPGYSVIVDAGVGNGPVAAVPEPETLWLLLAALPVVAWRKRAPHRGSLRDASNCLSWQRRPDTRARYIHREL
jgi:hypothetical protein